VSIRHDTITKKSTLKKNESNGKKVVSEKILLIEVRQMKLSEHEVELLGKIFQLALRYVDKKLPHEQLLGQQIRALRDRHNEASIKESTPTEPTPIVRCEEHDDKRTDCGVCYPAPTDEESERLGQSTCPTNTCE